jgi:hypothetical protein
MENSRTITERGSKSQRGRHVYGPCLRVLEVQSGENRRYRMAPLVLE